MKLKIYKNFKTIQQIIGKIDLKKPFILEFPKRIKIVSTHFISGIINEMLENPDINLDTIRKNITIKGNDNFVEKFYENIEKGEVYVNKPRKYK